MDEHELNELMRELLRAQAYRTGADVSAVRVNAEVKAKDEGCDGWSPQPGKPDRWLGEVPTCWQFKSGEAGIPSQMRGEVLKRIPRETLKAGGRFVVIASGSVNGQSGESVRKEILVQEAVTHSIPSEQIVVLGSEALALWCNEHPAIAARWALGLDGLIVFGVWETQRIHSALWQSNDAVRAKLAEFQRNLDFTDGTLLHLHIQGPPGVGKTRFALELCRSAPWRGAVVYVSQAQEVKLLELINAASADKGAQLMIVADEVQFPQLAVLRDSLDNGDGRIRLITIGHSISPNPVLSPSYEVGPLDKSSMAEVVKGWHPGMPYEHVEFVVRLADGFVRLAKLAAQTVSDNPTTDVRKILDLKQVEDFLAKMLGNGTRRGLHVLACLSIVGWSDDVQDEGRTIAEHFGWNWNDVRLEVDAFHRDFGIAPRGGRYRYISPRPLANYLAMEVWRVFPDEMKTLPDKLPNEKARESYYERLSQIASSPQAQSFSREQLGFFLTLDDFMAPRAARRWAVLVNADPTASAKALSEILASSLVDERRRLADSARREVVWALVRLAWGKTGFGYASKALALLAEAENETWANNATAEFVNGYKLVLGGTALRYQERLKVLDELLALNRPQMTQLVIRALAQIGNRHATRTGFEPAGSGLPELEWQPRGRDKLDCTILALQFLTRIALKAEPELKDDLMNAAQTVSWMLGESVVRSEVSNFLKSLRQAYPETREPLRALIARTISFERRERDAEAVADQIEMVQFLQTFEENTLWGRLQQLVGPRSWGEDEPDLAPLAQELLADPALLAAHWAWLTSGEANDSWKLGQALASLDVDGRLESLLPLLERRGSDHRIICMYVEKRREIKGDAWYEEWFQAQYARTPADLHLLVNVVWRAGATDGVLRLLCDAIKAHPIDDQLADALGYGRWYGEVSQEGLRELLQELITQDKYVSTVTVLHERITLRAHEIDWWEELALGVVMNVGLIHDMHNYASFHWKEVVEKYLDKHASKIVGRIFEAHMNQSKGYRAFDHYAEQIVKQALEIDSLGVWRELSAKLENPDMAYLFTLGFPDRIVDALPHDKIITWIDRDPKIRAPLFARLVKLDFRSDETLASKILGQFGELETVRDSFGAAFSSGMWSGTWSGHWNALAASLELVAERTSFDKLRSWAIEKAADLRLQAERDSIRDEEDDLPR